MALRSRRRSRCSSRLASVQALPTRFLFAGGWALAGLSHFAAAAIDGGPNCESLGLETFNESIGSREVPSLVIFHLPSCGACQRAFPHFTAAANVAAERGLPMRLAHVNCHDERTLCERFAIQSYPTIQLFADPGTFRKCKCQRTEVGFLNYIKHMSQPAVRRLVPTDTLPEVAAEEVMPAFAAALPSEEEVPIGLASVADSFRDMHSFVTAADLLSALPEDVRPHARDAAMVAYSPASQQWAAKNETAKAAVSAFTGDLANNDTVWEWLTRHRFPGIVRLGDVNFAEFTRSGMSTVVVAINPSQRLEIHQQVEEQLRRAHEKFSEKFYFGVVRAEGAWLDRLEYYSLYPRDLPRVLFSEQNMEVWIEDIEQLRVANLTEDLEALLAGAPLLRQGSLLANLWKIQRDGSRMVQWIVKIATRGPVEIICSIVVLCIVAQLVRQYLSAAREEEQQRENRRKELKADVERWKERLKSRETAAEGLNSESTMRGKTEDSSAEIRRRPGCHADAKEFEILLEKAASGPQSSVGVAIRHDGDSLRIRHLKEGLVPTWNEAHPDREVKPNDRIVEVCGVRGDPNKILNAIETNTLLKMKIERGS